MSAQDNTKIERVVEGVESLCTAVTAFHAGKAIVAVNGGPDTSVVDFKNVADARQDLRDAFAELLRPTLRVVG